MSQNLTEVDLFRINQAIDQSELERDDFILPTIIKNHNNKTRFSYDITSKQYPDFKFNFQLLPNTQRIAFRYTKEDLKVGQESCLREHLGINVQKWITHFKEYIKIREFNKKRPTTQFENFVDKADTNTETYFVEEGRKEKAELKQPIEKPTEKPLPHRAVEAIVLKVLPWSFVAILTAISIWSGNVWTALIAGVLSIVCLIFIKKIGGVIDSFTNKFPEN